MTKEDLKEKMESFAKTGDKEVFNNVAYSVTGKCGDIYYANFEGMPDELRKVISNYMLDTIFQRMVIPVIDEVRRITREDAINCYTDLQLVNELVKRNRFGEAPSETKRHGVWHEALIEAGVDETVHITFPDEALKHIKKA